jgi:hypothetical protein
VASSSTTGAADAGGSMASEVVDMMSAELLQINLKIYVLVHRTVMSLALEREIYNSFDLQLYVYLLTQAVYSV